MGISCQICWVLLLLSNPLTSVCLWEEPSPEPFQTKDGPSAWESNPIYSIFFSFFPAGGGSLFTLESCSESFSVEAGADGWVNIAFRLEITVCFPCVSISVQICKKLDLYYVANEKVAFQPCFDYKWSPRSKSTAISTSLQLSILTIAAILKAVRRCTNRLPWVMDHPNLGVEIIIL